MEDPGNRTSSWSGANSTILNSEAADREAPWRDIGSSMSAISFGFVATAILISMFLVMAVFEHLLRRNRSSLLHSRGTHGMSVEQGLPDSNLHPTGKSGSQMVVGHFLSDVSVMMPGQNYPTYIAQPAPLPCPREGMLWPSHDHNCHLPQP